MTEQGKVTAYEIQAQERSRGFERLLLILAAGTLSSAIFCVLLYQQTGAWQLLAGAGFLSPAVLIAGIGYRMARRERHAAAGHWMVVGLILACSGIELVWRGATLYIVINVLLLLSILNHLIRFAHRRIWLMAGGLYLVWILLVQRFEPISRYDIRQSDLMSVSIQGLTALVILVLSWQVVRAFYMGTIRTRLLMAMVTLVLLTAVASSVSAALLGWQSGQRQVVAQLQLLATLKEAEIEAWLDGMQGDLNSTQAQEDITQRTVTLLQVPNPSLYIAYLVRSYFQQTMEQTGRFDELFLVNLHGQVVLSTEITHEGNNYIDQAFFLEGLKGTYVQPPLALPGSSELSIIVTLPIVDTQEQVWGVLAGRTGTASLNEIMREQISLSQVGTTYLVSQDHTLLTESHANAPGIEVRTRGADTVTEKFVNGSGLYEDYRGEPVVGVYRWLPRLQVGLLAEEEQAQAFSSIYATLGVNVLISLLALSIAVFASFRVTRSIAEPLTKLANTAIQIADGNLDLQADVEREDEIGTLAQSFNSMTVQLRDLIAGLEQRVTDRTRDLQTAAEVSRATTAVLDTDELLRQTVNLVRERFDLYYVGLFLLDRERRFGVLRAGTGEAGQKMLAEGHKLMTGGSSMIGQCTAKAEARIALDVGDEAVRFDNPHLPRTRSEMALPLRARGQVVGAMTVQSEQEAAFDAADIAVMQTVADQVAVAIDNAQLFADAQAAVDEMQAVQRRYLAQSWREYTLGREISGYEQTDASLLPLGKKVLPEVQRAVTEQERVILLGDENQSDEPSTVSLAVPIMLRGQPIGALGLKTTREKKWRAEDVALVESIAEQLALATENLRLLDESQRRAIQERLVTKISTHVRASTKVETILSTAIGELGRALRASEGLIQLETSNGADSTVSEE